MAFGEIGGCYKGGAWCLFRFLGQIEKKPPLHQRCLHTDKFSSKPSGGAIPGPKIPLQMNHSSQSPPNPTIKSLLAFLSAQCCTAAFIALFFTRFWLVSALYAAWWLIDREKPSKGGRRSHVLRNCIVWKYMRDYFPITVSATTPLALPCFRNQFCPWSLDTVRGQQSWHGVLGAWC